MKHVPLQVATFVNDSTNPMLFGFNLNLTSEILTLMFSETVRVATLDVRQITLQNVLMTEFWQLLAGQVLTTTDDTVVEIKVDTRDLNEIKVRTDLATIENNTFVSVTGRLIQDMNLNWNDPISPIQPTRVSEFTADFVEPELVSFDLDMDGSGLLILTFTESVNVSSLDVMQLSLLKTPSNESASYTLSSLSYSETGNGPVVEIQLHLDDLNQIKVISELATSRLTTYLGITAGLISDMNANPKY